METIISNREFTRGLHQGYVNALKDMLQKEELVLLLSDENTDRQDFQVQTNVIESKHLRQMLEALLRNRSSDS